MKTLALITARSGSKRIPHKNHIILGEKSLYQWTTCLPLNSVLTATAFSSDRNDEYVLPIGCVVIDRPKELAQDDTPHGPVILHGLLEVERRLAETFDYVMLLQPTNPGRTMDEVERAVEMCKQTDCNFLYCYYEDHNLDGRYIAGNVIPGPVVIRSGCVYMYSRNYIILGFPETDNRVAMKVSKTRGYNINVPEDIFIQEALWRSEEV